MFFSFSFLGSTQIPCAARLLCRMDQGHGLLNRSVHVSISNVLAPSYPASRGPSDLFRKVGKRKGPLFAG